MSGLQIWEPNGLRPDNAALFRQCVRGAAKDMLESKVLDYEWMAYYDDHVHNVDKDGKEIPGQSVSDDIFKWNVIRYHKYLTGRIGPEWTVERSLPCNDGTNYIPLSKSDRCVAFKSSEKTKMKDFKKKVLPYILAHDDVTKVYFVHMRIISQWRDYELPRLLG